MRMPTRKNRGDNATFTKPLLVNNSTAKRLLGVGNTKYWQLVKAGKIEMVDTGIGYRMPSYASLERLAQQPKR
jgi:hypothetical protein